MAMVTLPIAKEISEKIVDGLVSGALQHLLRKRMEDARRRLIRRLERGQTWAWTEDESAAALFGYFRAAQEGAARINLELMADAFANGATDATLSSDVFRRHSQMLASLSRDEVLFLAGLDKAEHERARANSEVDQLVTGWVRLYNSPSSYGVPDSVDIYACAPALLRTGWLSAASAFGGLIYEFTATFNEVRRLVDFEEAANAAENSPES